jgi:polyisoprenyl-teichoic acid--peptidoglycan teichoic acid transferase
MAEKRTPGKIGVNTRSRAMRSHWYHPAIKSDLAAEPQADQAAQKVKARDRVRRRQEERQMPKLEWTWLIIGAALLCVVGLVAVLNLVSNNGVAAGGIREGLGSAGVLATPQDQVQPQAAAPLATVEIKPFEGTGRITILLMGIDKRPGEAGRTFRTDTMILLSLDTTTKRMSMLSIPRDLRVPLPGETELTPINAAYVIGELRRPGYGPQLSLETVQYNLGIPIQYYVVVTFPVLIKLVDAVGGIDIDVEHDIVDEQYPDMNSYGYDPLYISAGKVHMDGELALKYARTRHQTSDFDRAKRQQQVILELRNKATKPEVLVSLVPQLPAIWQDLQSNIILDPKLDFDKLLSLGWYVKDISLSNLQRGSLDGEFVLPVQENGYTILTINRARIIDLMVQVFGPDYNK